MEQARRLRAMIEAARDAAQKKKHQPTIDDCNNKLRELGRELGELEQNIAIAQRAQAEAHNQLLRKRVKVVTSSTTMRGGFPVAVQVIVKVGGQSFTRHLKLQAGGVYTGRGVGAAAYLNTFYAYHPFAVYPDDLAQQAA